jgi:hypothetical protein
MGFDENFQKALRAAKIKAPKGMFGKMKAINRPARAVATEKVKTKIGVYTLKVVMDKDRHFDKYEIRTVYPDGTESYSSLHFETAAKALERGRASIKAHVESEIEKRGKQKHEAALPKGITPSFEKAIKFFKEHGGGRVGHAAEGALHLARAEKYAEDHDWTFEWKDDEGADMSGIEDAKEVLLVALKDQNGKVIGSLGGVADPSKSYARLVEAELALEAMPDK